jgi:hypothetical protein
LDHNNNNNNNTNNNNNNNNNNVNDTTTPTLTATPTTTTTTTRRGGPIKADSTLRTSRAVPHPSTNRALCRLTSEVERDPVHSTRYGRQRKQPIGNNNKGKNINDFNDNNNNNIDNNNNHDNNIKFNR